MRLFQSKTKEELLKLYNIYYDTIYGVNSCYGVKDMKILLELEHELQIKGDKRCK
jgi:hypothetical protein